MNYESDESDSYLFLLYSENSQVLRKSQSLYSDFQIHSMFAKITSIKNLQVIFLILFLFSHW